MAQFVKVIAIDDEGTIPVIINIDMITHIKQDRKDFLVFLHGSQYPLHLESLPAVLNSTIQG